MDKNIMRKMGGMGRRRFISIASSLGVSGSGLYGLTQDVFAEKIDNPKKEVLRIRGWKHTNQAEIENKGAVPLNAPVYYKIPFEDWLITEGTAKAARTLGKRFSNPRIQTGVANYGRDLSGYHVEVSYDIYSDEDGNNAQSINEFELLKANTPNSMDVKLDYAGESHTIKNINIDVVKLKKEIASSQVCTVGQYFVNIYRPLPAGCEAGRTANPDQYAFSLSSPSRDPYGNGYIFTAGHAAKSVGNTIYQNSLDSSNSIGTVSSVASQTDAAIIGIDSGVSLRWDLAADGGGYENLSLIGVVSPSYMKDNVNSLYLYKQGRSSGRNGGYLTKYVTNTSCDVIHTDAAAIGGDSGGIIYQLDPVYEEIWAASLLDFAINTDGDSCYEGSGGPVYRQLEDIFNVSI